MTQKRMTHPIQRRMSQRVRRPATVCMAKQIEDMRQNEVPTFIPPDFPTNAELPTFDEHYEWIEAFFNELQEQYPDMSPAEILAINDTKTTDDKDSNDDTATRLRRPMPRTTDLPPVMPTGPLNLNPDGSDITYKKAHAGPNAVHWRKADSEEMERLFITGTMQPRFFPDIPKDRVITYVNPVCVQKN
jgi:hypothetical protein